MRNFSTLLRENAGTALENTAYKSRQNDAKRRTSSVNSNFMTLQQSYKPTAEIGPKANLITVNETSGCSRKIAHSLMHHDIATVSRRVTRGLTKVFTN